VAALETGIQSIFTKIGCSNSAVSEMLGTMGVTESNIMQYLGIIEQRTNELLQLWKMQQAAAHSTMGSSAISLESSQPASMLAGPAAPPGGISITIDPPMIGDDDDSEEDTEEDEERPLSRDELKAKTIRGLSKREGQRASKAQKKKDALGKRRL
jgi:hypothetical protein